MNRWFLAFFLFPSLLNNQAVANEVIWKSTAPIYVGDHWLGHSVANDFTRVLKKRITAPILILKRNGFQSEVTVLKSNWDMRASARAFGINAAVAQKNGQRFSLYRAFEITEIHELDMARSKTIKGPPRYVAMRIYYGWSLSLLASGKTSSFTAEAAGSIFSVGASARTQAKFWDAKVVVRLRGLSRRNPGEVAIPTGIADIKKQFVVGKPQPIFVDYLPMGKPGNLAVSWPTFSPPSFERFDAASDFRLFRDPRVTPGKLQINLENKHKGDRVVFELWKQGMGRHAFQWQLRPSQKLTRTITSTAFPVKLVWVGHASRNANQVPDPHTGWTLEFRRNW
ncbi:hypothetical protein JYT15_00275 [Acidimicrobium ferrooxidans]|nr:hypothetical protein [Acidimicrobium ferrooxidans]